MIWDMRYGETLDLKIHNVEETLSLLKQQLEILVFQLNRTKLREQNETTLYFIV